MFGSLVRAMFALAAALERLAAVLAPSEPTMAERSKVGLRLSVQNDPTAHGGHMSLALAMTDVQRCRFDLTVPNTDIDGKILRNPDGTPWQPVVEWATDAAAVADVTLEGTDGLAGWIASGDVGQAVITLTVGPYPDGSTSTETINVAIGNSAPGPLNLVLGTPENEA
jgi:hypothetical protein